MIKGNGKLILAGIGVVIIILVIRYSKSQEHYQPIDELPSYQQDSKPQDGDTQADTIKALQAYAKAAVDKSTELNQRAEENLNQILENHQQVIRLEQEKQLIKAQQEQDKQRLKTLQDDFNKLQQQLERQLPPPTDQDLPVGFGFDGLIKRINPSKGAWYSPLDFNDQQDQETNSSNYRRLLKPHSGITAGSTHAQLVADKPEQENKPVYTIPKDSMLTDAVALTALIGRIPVNGTTPDPYPVKLFVGRENLAANGHQLPEVAGMLFSGLGFGDWNLSCVSVRLLSATFIFTDGAIVNHSQTDKPLGYISDPSGIPCISGKFVSNAPQFLLQRAGLAGLGAAGTAYAEAQQQTQTSPLTGTTTRSLLGDINKLVAGKVVQSATEDINQWLLERQQQSFDAVVVNPGAAVAIHLDTSLTIDYQPTARKVRYAQDSTFYNHTGLD